MKTSTKVAIGISILLIALILIFTTHIHYIPQDKIIVNILPGLWNGIVISPNGWFIIVGGGR